MIIEKKHRLDITKLMKRFFRPHSLLFQCYKLRRPDVLECEHPYFRAKKNYLINQSEFFGFNIIADPKVD